METSFRGPTQPVAGHFRTSIKESPLFEIILRMVNVPRSDVLVSDMFKTDQCFARGPQDYKRLAHPYPPDGNVDDHNMARDIIQGVRKQTDGQAGLNTQACARTHTHSERGTPIRAYANIHRHFHRRTQT